MVGVICNKDVLIHPYLVIKEYGWPLYWKVIKITIQGKRVSFLQLVMEVKL